MVVIAVAVAQEGMLEQEEMQVTVILLIRLLVLGVQERVGVLCSLITLVAVAVAVLVFLEKEQVEFPLITARGDLAMEPQVLAAVAVPVEQTVTLIAAALAATAVLMVAVAVPGCIFKAMVHMVFLDQGQVALSASSGALIVRSPQQIL